MFINMPRRASAERLLEPSDKPVIVPSYWPAERFAAQSAEIQMELFYREYRKSPAYLFA